MLSAEIRQPLLLDRVLVALAAFKCWSLVDVYISDVEVVLN